MNIDKIARRYALAVYRTAQEKGALPALVADTAVIQDLYRTVPDLPAALANPRLSSPQKQMVVESAFRGSISDDTLVFLRFMGHKNRLPILAEVFTAVQAIHREAEGIIDAGVWSPRPFGPAEKADLQRHLDRRTGKKVNLEFREEPGLLGGFKVIFPDYVLDCSVSHQLETLKQNLMAG
jgi:F-type H+-transporting ATPase subunit delta